MRHAIVRYSAALVAASLLVVPLGVAHRGYLVIAAILGAIFFGWGCYGLRQDAGLLEVKLRSQRTRHQPKSPLQ